MAPRRSRNKHSSRTSSPGRRLGITKPGFACMSRCQRNSSTSSAADSRLVLLANPVKLDDDSADSEQPHLDDTESALLSSGMSAQIESEPKCAPAKLFEPDLAMMIAELAHYKERCEVAEEQAKSENNLRRQIQSLSKVPEETAKTVFQLRRRVNTLEKRLEDRRTLEGFLAIDAIQTTASDSQQILTKFEVLKDQLHKLIVMDGTYRPSVRGLKGHSDDLDNLLTDVFGKESLTGPQELPEASSAFTAFELVQALVGAALKSWVFESEFSMYAFAPTALLQGYRKSIAITCGHNNLYDLDVAVHKSIIRKPVFEEVMVPGIIERFITRLIDALRPVFKSESRSAGIEKLESSLYSVMRSAVQLRAEMLITGDSYELVWPVVGSSFNRNEMQTTRAVSTATSSAVRLSLCPGFRVCVRRKAMVDNRGFTVAATGLLKPKYVLKALVLR